MNKRETNRLLGYPDDARLLIINADDFGMCNSINEAIIQVLESGVVRSTSLMVACPWAMHANHYLQDHPEIQFGVHLTVICDSDDYCWGPITSKDAVPDLVDQAGHFYSFERFHKLIINQEILRQLELEFRSQIDTVLATGLKPAHLDWHAIRLEGREAIFDLMFRLAKEYGLALRVARRPHIQIVQRTSLMCNDYDFMDSYLIKPDNKAARYAQMLHDLPAGLSEWAVHPGLDNPELLAMEPDGNHFRQTDFDYWTSQETKAIIEKGGIILINHRAIQEFWRDR
jgi:predicted glycoside hydrolase/deacetylase ChbG (UPF0249 family)